MLPIGEHYDKLIKHTDHLPPRYNAIYQLSHLTESALKKLVDTNRLSPSLEDLEVTALIPVSRQNSQQAPPNASEAAVSLARIVQTKKRLSSETKEKLRKIISQLKKVDGIELRFSEGGEQFDAEPRQ